MSNIFFSDENYKHICKQIEQNIKFSFGISIQGNEKYEHKILDTMKCIHTKRQKFNIPFGVTEKNLSDILSEKTIKYFLLYFEKNLSTPSSTSRINYLEQSEMNNLYLNEYDTHDQHGDYMKLNAEEDNSVLTNEYNNNNSEDVFTLKQNPIHQQENIQEPPITTENTFDIGKETRQLFHTLKDSDTFKLKTYNLVIDTADCALNCSGKSTPFNINVRFGTQTAINNSVCNNLNIKNDFKDVHSLKISRVIIPASLMNTFRYPFLYLCIEEYESNVITTGNVKNIFSKIYLDNNTANESCGVNDCSGFMHFVNMENDIKIFKAPLSQISKLSISLVNPKGNTVCNNFKYNTSGCGNDTNYYPDTYVQYIFELTTIENYVPHMNSYPFNS